MIEHRRASLEIRGREISGLAVPWGQRARVRAPDGELVQETFVRGSFGSLSAVPLMVEHGGPRIGEVEPRATERGLEVRGEYTGDLGNRDRFSVEFRCLAETRSQDLRIVTSAELHGVAAVRAPAYTGAEIEARQGASLLLVEGPPGAGKSQEIARLMASDQLDMVADLTALWAAIGAFERGADGRYPVREDTDDLLAIGLYLKTVAVRQGLRRGLRVAVTTSARNQFEKWQEIASEAGVTVRAQALDVPYEVARARLEDGDGELHPQCAAALERWYGEVRSTTSMRHGGLVGWL